MLRGASIPNVVVIATIISESEAVMRKAQVNIIFFISFILNNELKRKKQNEEARNIKPLGTNVRDANINKMLITDIKTIYFFVDIFLPPNFEKNTCPMYISKMEPTTVAIMFMFTTSYFLNIYQMLVMRLLFFEHLSLPWYHQIRLHLWGQSALYNPYSQ